jgi:hypothetical protein
MATAVGVAASTVQAIWNANGLAPHRWRQFKLSRDPTFARNGTTWGALWVDEKSQIQALDWTQPGLPMKKGWARP